jgi:hypothetical protein
VIKRVNFTGRKRIPRSCVDIEVYDGPPRAFDATIKLDDVQLMAGAAVVLEAMCAGSNAVERFEFGEVGNIQPPKEPKLQEVEGENVFFTLKVVDRTERFGRIIGLAEHIRPQRAGKQTAAGRRGILPIDKQDLGQQIWRLDYGAHDVTLLVNDKIPGLADRARSDALFYGSPHLEPRDLGGRRHRGGERCLADGVAAVCEEPASRTRVAPVKGRVPRGSRGLD